ncbi:unnamed protein product [Gadus morhua 'NCC']
MFFKVDQQGVTNRTADLLRRSAIATTTLDPNPVPRTTHHAALGSGVWTAPITTGRGALLLLLLLMMKPSDARLLELLGTLLSIAAWLLSMATTFTSTWLTLSTELLPSESYQLGLWETCVVQDLGVQECRPYDSLLGLPPDIKLARILMCVALGTGLLGALLAVPGTHAVTACDPRLEDPEVKRVMKRVGGALCLATGVLGLLPVSHVAHLTVVRFFDPGLPALVPRWEFGSALFLGWTAGVVHLAAGGLLLASARRGRRGPRDTPIPLAGVRSQDRGPRTRDESV